MITLGRWYRDTALGIVGTAVSRTEHLGGSPVVKLQWLGADDEAKEHYVEEARLEEVAAARDVGFHPAMNGHH